MVQNYSKLFDPKILTTTQSFVHKLVCVKRMLGKQADIKLHKFKIVKIYFKIQNHPNDLKFVPVNCKST